jgi:release factor glutamine methyltransferase
MLVKDLLKESAKRLSNAGIPNADLEAALLLSHQLGIDKVGIYLAVDRIVTPGQLELFQNLLERRLSREPLAYILGEKEFWSLPFQVTRDVLIPRPETEFLIETLLHELADDQNDQLEILDLGTGSGVIAIVLAIEIADARITAIDFSAAALRIALENCRRHGVEDRLVLLNSDWFSAIPPGKSFDVVVSNPPYISRAVLDMPVGETQEGLQPEVGCHEPGLALDGGKKGMESIFRISKELLRFLRPGGWFFMEIGADQGEDVMDLFMAVPGYESLKVHDDYAGLPRVFQARRKK